MADKPNAGSKPGLIQCDQCGELYSDTYRRCPFCDEYEDESSERPRGGKRLAPSNRRGGGYTKTSPLKVISIVISLAVILFAAWIVISVVLPLIQRGDVPALDPSASQSVNPDPAVSDTDPPVSGEDPAVSDEPPAVSDPAVSDPDPVTTEPPAVSETPSPSPSVSTQPTDSGATGFTLSKSEFTFSNQYPNPVTLTVTFTPAGTTGTVTWASSDSEIVSVDANGKVSPGSKTGTATITATLSNGATQTCKVHNQVSGSTASNNTNSNTAASTGSYTVNNSDFTLYSVGETYQLKVNGYTGGVSWTSSNTGVATVSSDGTVTAVGSGRGNCTITGTLDNGSTVTAIVRINIS